MYKLDSDTEQPAFSIALTLRCTCKFIVAQKNPIGKNSGSGRMGHLQGPGDVYNVDHRSPRTTDAFESGRNDGEKSARTVD